MEITNEMLASKGKRFGNLVIDLIVRYLIFMVIGFVAATIDPEAFLRWAENVSRIEDILYSVLLLLIYYIAMEALTHRTVGKYITGTKVVMADGSAPSASVIVKRSFCRFIPFEAFTFFGQDGTGWHDRFSDTYVVDVKLFEEAKRLKTSFDEIGNTEI